MDPPTKRIALTLLPHLLTWSTSTPNNNPLLRAPIGQFWENAKVVRIVAGTGGYTGDEDGGSGGGVEGLIMEWEGCKGVYGFVHVSINMGFCFFDGDFIFFWFWVFGFFGFLVEFNLNFFIMSCPHSAHPPLRHHHHHNHHPTRYQTKTRHWHSPPCPCRCS